jgi:hypothetical protein
MKIAIGGPWSLEKKSRFGLIAFLGPKNHEYIMKRSEEIRI